MQAQLERVNRVLLKNHLSNCVAEAIRSGQGKQKIDELLEGLKYNAGLSGQSPDLAVVAAIGDADPIAAPSKTTRR